MPRNALVTGGTRGIGAAISNALKAAGYKVAANYGGNDDAGGEIQGREPPSRCTNGTSHRSKLAPPASSRARRTSVRSKSWSTMPASRATPSFTA